MAEFEPAVEFVLSHEGGLSDDPLDHGGITNFGISLRTHPSLGVDGIRNLSIEGAKDIYRKEFWDGLPYRNIGEQMIANKVMDMAVNMGFHEAHCLVQKAVNLTADFRLMVDGAFGPNTLAAVNGCKDDDLLGNIRNQAAAYYMKLVNKRPSNEKFLKGWINRANA